MKETENVNRRQFLRHSSQLAIKSISFPYFINTVVFGKSGRITPSNRITVGCIGVGGVGVWDLKSFLSKKAAQVVVVCDVDSEHRQRGVKIVNQAYGNQNCAGYRDFRNLITRSDIDVVSISTPDHWHAIIAVMAAREGKHIFCQKPLAYNIAEGRAICEAVKKHKIIWQTGSQQRSSKRFRYACELIRNGRIGNVHTVRVTLPPKNKTYRGNSTEVAPVPKGFDYDTWLGPAPWASYCPGRCHADFRWITDYSGGQITDWAGHHCDIAQWAMGTELASPVEIEGAGIYPNHHLYNTVEDYEFVCKYSQGFKMIVAGGFPLGIRFEGTEGWLFVSRSMIDAEPKSILTSSIGPNEIHLYRSDDHKGNFLDCIYKQTQTVAPAEVAHRSIMIGHLGLIAIKLGRKLRWNPQKEHFVNDSEANRLLSRPMRSPWFL